jgi:hypothetical protein
VFGLTLEFRYCAVSKTIRMGTAIYTRLLVLQSAKAALGQNLNGQRAFSSPLISSAASVHPLLQSESGKGTDPLICI